MDRSITNNKMLSLETENKSEVKFNVAIHGFKKGQIVRYNSVPNSKKILIRRRLFDNDGSVEIVDKSPKDLNQLETREVLNNKQSSKPIYNKKGSIKSKEEDI